MDTQLLYVLGGIAFVVVMPWLEERLSGKKHKKTTAQRSSAPLRQQPVYPTVSAQKTRHAEMPPVFEEGKRVTSDTPKKQSYVETGQPRIKTLDIEGLRKVVIWSEILKPKF